MTYRATLGMTALVVAVAAAATASDIQTPNRAVDDSASCPADDFARPEPPLLVDAEHNPLAAYQELDRWARTRCAPKPAVRAWHDLRQRLAPFTESPDPAWRLHAWETARSMPVVEPADGGWTSIGPTNVGGRIRALVIDPRNESVVLAAGADGGVWKTTDGGLSWTPKTDHLGSLASGALVMDPSNPDIVYYGTGEGPHTYGDPLPGVGVFKSTDAGETWAAAGDLFSTRINKMAVVSSSSIAVLAASNNGIYRSTDGGSTWKRTRSGVATSVIAEPGSATVVWGAIGNIAGDSANGVYKSTDAGTSWTKAPGTAPSNSSSCGRIELALGPANPNTIYAACQSTAAADYYESRGVWKSTDAGATWAVLASAPNYCGGAQGVPAGVLTQCFYDNAMSVDPSDSGILWLGGIDVYRSVNGGTSFSLKSAYYSSAAAQMHPDQHAIAISATGVVWVGNDGGVWKSTDAGSTWQDMSNGLVTSQFYGIAQHPTSRFPVAGGLQDNGTQRHLGNESHTYKEVIGGDGGFVAVNNTSPTIWVGEYVYLEMHRSTNTASSFDQFNSCTNGIPSAEVGNGCGANCDTLFIAPFVTDPVRGNRMLAGTNKVYYSENNCQAWSNVNAGQVLASNGAITALAFDFLDENTWWVGTETGEVWVNHGFFQSKAWEKVSKSPLPFKYVTRISPDPTNTSVAYVTYSGTGNGHVFKTADGGTTWADVSGNLPDAPVNGLVVDPQNASRIWVGTDIGVYISETGGTNWARYGSGLPFARVDELLFHSTLRLLRAGTHGRGIWEASADLAAVYPPTAAFEIAPTAPRTGETTTFTDRSTGDPTAWAWTFGDGGTSSDQNPTHVYTQTGPMTVKLTATNAAGSATTSKSVVVEKGSTTVTYSAAMALPGQARAEGAAGSFFKTSLWATNPGAASVRLRLKYVPAAGGSAGGAAESKDITIAPNVSLAYGDVLSEAFGATTNTSGVIVVELANGDGSPIVTSRTYNDSASGTYGQYIPAVRLTTTALAATGESWLHGLVGNAAFRTNVGVVNLSAASATATLSLRNASGAPLGSDIALTIPANSVVQTNRVNEAAGAGNQDLFSVRITSSSSVFAYASHLDNLTSDPVFVPGTLAAATHQAIDGVAQASGAGGTFFRSSFSLTNPGSAATTVGLQFVKRSETAVTATASVDLLAGESKRWSDVVGDLLGVSGVAGRLDIASSQPVVAWARTYNDLGAAGTFGQFIPGFASADLIGSKGAILQGLGENTDVRTNLGLVNTSTDDVQVTLVARGSDGAKIGEQTYTVLGGQSLFKARILSELVPGQSIANGYLKVTASAPGVVYAWASYVDNHSTDQTFVRPVSVP